jgi:hypothetical protein
MIGTTSLGVWMRERLPAGLGALAVATLLLTSPLAPASSATRTDNPGGAHQQVQRVTFTTLAPPLQPLEPKCDQLQHCVLPVLGTSTYGGDWTGSDVDATGSTLIGSSYVAAATSVFTGAIKGCGTGTLVVRLLAIGQTGKGGPGTWTIAAGFGSGGLTTTTGEGTWRSTTSPDNSTTGTFTGKVNCQRP